MKKFYTSGRPAWYDSRGDPKEPFVIGIAGGTASGKSSVCREIVRRLNLRWIAAISTDSFYNVLSKEQHDDAVAGNFNFDEPKAFDWPLLRATLSDLKEGKKVNIPIYDFVTHSRLESVETVYGADIVILEGIMALYDAEIRSQLDMKVFVDTDSDVRLARRIRRDISERGRDVEGVLMQYLKYVKPSYDEFVNPTMRFADIIVPRGSENVVAIDLIVTHIQKKIKERGYRSSIDTGRVNVNNLPSNVSLLPQGPRLEALHTIIRNRSTSRGELIFYTECLARKVIEVGLNVFEAQDKVVTTRVDCQFHGKDIRMPFCGVSVLRGGDTMLRAMQQVVRDAKIGEILIQSNEEKMHPFIGSGRTACMAVRVLVEHGVPLNQIAFLCLISSPRGLHNLLSNAPSIHIVTSAIDAGLDRDGFLNPGAGNIGDRFFGTTSVR